MSSRTQQGQMADEEGLDDPSAQQIILALDIGSSSVRCTAYEFSESDYCLVGGRITTVSRTMRLVQPNSGAIYVQNVLEGVDECIEEVIQKLLEVRECCESSSSFQVRAVGFSSFVMNFVGVNSDGCSVGPEATLSYACNSEAVSEEVLSLKSDLGDEALADIYRKTGAPIHAAYALPQLRVLYNLKSQTCRQIHKWQTLSSLILARWLNVQFLPISYSEASWTGLLNYQTCRYEASVLDLLPGACVKALPYVADFNDDDRFNQLLCTGIPERSPYFIRWPELRHARFFLGLGDGACANFGSKCNDPSRIACTVGTSAAARVVLPLPIHHLTVASTTTLHANGSSEQIEPLDEAKKNSHGNHGSRAGVYFMPGLFCYRIDKDHVLLGGALTDGGSIIEWICQLLNVRSEEEFQNVMTEAGELLEDDSASGSSPTTSSGRPNVRNSPSASVQSRSGLLFVPFLSGERSTGFRTGATGALLGLTRTTTPAHLFKACLEGLTLRLKAVIELLCQAVVENTELCDAVDPGAVRTSNTSETCSERQLPQIVASGKALEANTLLRKMLADSTGLPVILDEDTSEGTSRGVAKLVVDSLRHYSHKISQQGNRNHRMDAVPPSSSSSRLKRRESFRLVKVQRPRQSAKAYWERAASAQGAFIDAISPLYDSNA